MKTYSCDVGGMYWYPVIPGPAVYDPPCGAAPVIRWRAPYFVEGHWLGRCSRHAAELSTDDLTIENL